MSFIKSVNSEQAEKLIKEYEDLLIIDVRKFNEYREVKIPKAINIPVEELEWEIEDLGKYKDKPILIYCKAGHKSSLACSILKEEGFNKLYNLGTGMLGYSGKVE